MYQFSNGSNYTKVYQLYFGASRKLNKYFSIGANLLAGYNTREHWMGFSSSSFDATDSSSIADCKLCLEEYLGDSYDPTHEKQIHKVGHSNKLSLGTSFLLKFEFPIGKRLGLQLKYGAEIYYNFDLGSSIDFEPLVDFYPNSYYVGTHYLTTGLSFKF